jgi:hypothetical protein
VIASGVREDAPRDALLRDADFFLLEDDFLLDEDFLLADFFAAIVLSRGKCYARL